MIEKIHCAVPGEECLKYVHKSGVTVYMEPIEGLSTAAAQYTAKFGAVDSKALLSDGSVLDIPDGTAHYLEHKLFESEDSDTFARFAKNGAYCNAGTSYDCTSYYFSCTDNFTDNLEILLDFVKSPYFTPQNVDKERGIITQEIAMYRDNPSWRALMGCLKGMYGVNPVKNDIAGDENSIAKITDELLYKVYGAFYTPKNMYLTVAGNFDPEDVIKACDKYLPDTESGAPAKSVREKEPEAVRERRVNISMSVARPVFSIGIKCPDAEGKELWEDRIYLALISYLLFGDVSDFSERLRENGLINDFFSVQPLCGRGYSSLVVGGISDEPQRVLEEMQKEIRRFKSEPPSEKDFLRTKKASYGGWIYSLSAADSIAQVFTSAAIADMPPFGILEMSAGADYEEMLRRLSSLDENNACLSVVEPL